VSLAAISPLDGRYAGQVAELAAHVSEEALIRRRIEVELAWLRALRPDLDVPDVVADAAAAAEVKAIERRTNHDVKAVELFLRERVAPEAREWVHFALTSEDVNNLAYAGS
jgi:adenylosuccinate lyase